MQSVCMLCFLRRGDPNDNTIRNVEKEVVIPQRMRDKAKEKCATEVAGIVTQHQYDFH